MKCPYCQREMSRGYLYNGSQPVAWIPEGKKPSRISFSVPESGVKLANTFSMFKIGGYSAEAYHCSACDIVIAKTEA